MRIEMRLVQYSYSSTQAQYSSYSHYSSFSSSKPKLFFKKPRWPRMDSTPHHRKTNHSHNHNHKKKDKIVVIMGATGTGKSKLSIDLATRFHAEIINSDKMQVYNGLDITTNKIPLHQRCGITHHLLGEVDPVLHDDFSPLDFRNLAGSVISDIVSRRKLPLIVGGSNSFVHALLVDRFDPDSNIFGRYFKVQLLFPMGRRVNEGLPTALQSCTSLSSLSIEECPNLMLIPELRKLHSLTVLQIETLSLSNFTSLKYYHSLTDNKILHFTSLKYLYVHNFDGLEALPEWLSNFSSLQRLELWSCKNLMYLPTSQAMQRLTKLHSLLINFCPKLKERCARGSGAEWSKIAHIPNVNV